MIPLPSVLPTLLLSLFLLLCPRVLPAAAPRESLIRLLTAGDASSQTEGVRSLAGLDDPWVREVLAAWRQGSVHLLSEGERKIPVVLTTPIETGEEGFVTLVETGEVLAAAGGEPLKVQAERLEPLETTAGLRRAIKTALDVAALRSSEPKKRRDAARKLGQDQNTEYLAFFQAALAQEQSKEVKAALEEAIGVTQLIDPDPAVQLAGVRTLARLRSVAALSALKTLAAELQKEPDEARAAAQKGLQRHLQVALLDLERYVALGNLAGTGFRGLSLAAVLLVAALGLAITFGLMGIINMAHGELIMAGAYAAYMTQNVCAQWFGDAGREVFFPFAIAFAFVLAAGLGLILERGVVRHLYRRPLESMLATWGVSLFLRQGYRHVFGAANVQVDSPSWLSGSFVVCDVLFAYNRVFVIFFGLLTVAGTWLLLSRTSLGLQVRAVMQNRGMAAALGVRTERVNMLTFALGSGLAGVAGACLSQIGNVGPGLGQSYIVDCFMVVVLGGVGSLMGTVLAALGIGVGDQILQPWLGAVLGKITVLFGIILFLQWRPSGFFTQKSRSLDS
jgi:urea transport system permease protein